jgi:3',5'-cyclic AMP phosphodiesterase CpdA
VLDATPRNSNLRLLKSADAISEDVDAVVVTGDLTDDGVGYELVRTAFQRFADRGMLFVVPGNHDRYLFPIAGSARPRPTAQTKQRAFAAFAESLGLRLDPCGAWVRTLEEAETVLVGLDSCSRKQRRFFRHNGALGQEQLAYLRRLAQEDAWKGARHRIVLLHHHVVPLPHGVGRRAPPEVGMRLDDARAAAECFDEIGVTIVLHGHRHVSEQRQPAGSKFLILAAPSFTLGCRSGDAPSYWRVELGERAHISRATVALTSTHDADAVSVADVEPGSESELAGDVDDGDASDPLEGL